MRRPIRCVGISPRATALRRLSLLIFTVMANSANVRNDAGSNIVVALSGWAVVFSRVDARQFVFARWTLCNFITRSGVFLVKKMLDRDVERLTDGHERFNAWVSLSRFVGVDILGGNPNALAELILGLA